MVQSCSAYNCNERHKRGTDISFHLFPQDIILKKQWILAMRREKFKPSKYSRICSKHFTPDSFSTSPWSSIKKLKNHAVPSVFDFPDHLVKKVITRKLPASRNVNVENQDNLETTNKETSEEASTESLLDSSVKKRRLYYVGDFKEYCLYVNGLKSQRYKLSVKRHLSKKNKQIKILKQKNRRLTKKISDLKYLLEHLKQKQMIDEESSLKLLEENKWTEFEENKMFVSETNININGTEFMNCTSDNKTEQCEIPTLNIKTELLACEEDINTTSNNLNIENEIRVVDVMKFEYEDGLLFCGDCQAYYEDYCIKCGMLVHILDKITSNNADNITHEELPKHILEIGDTFGKFGVYALKVIPEGVKFGPFTGPNCSAGSWKIKRGKFVANEERSKFLSWMQYINPARNAFDRNLLPFQYEDKLYYRSIRQIQVGDELLAYFGEAYEDVLDEDDEIDYIPTVEVTCRAVFACIFCCLGFSLRVHLDQHKKICQNRSNEMFSVKELAQCQFCKVYMAEKEYMEYHMTYCQERNERKCITWLLDNQNSEAKEAKTRRRRIYKCPHCTYKTQYKGDLKIHTNKHYDVKTHRCGICSKRFKTKKALTVHVEGVHFLPDRENFKDQSSSENSKTPQDKTTSHPKALIKRYKCPLCDFRTKHKYYMKVHTKTKHLEQFDFICATCEYRTNYKPTLDRHIKTKHLKEFDYKCASCEFRTNRKDNLEKHIKTKHLNEFDYKCNVCDYKTNKRTTLEIHIKSKHLDDFDYKCDICDYKTYDKRCLQRHVKIIHLQEFSYKCEICEYKTQHMGDLGRHVKTKHLEQFDYQCEMCDYKTNAKRDSEKHLRIKHLKQFKHACDFCDYKTYDKRNLNRHRKRKHLNVFDFSCDECEYKTNERASLNDHVKTKHLKQFDYNCTVCNYQTNKRHNFEGHMKRKHFKH